MDNIINMAEEHEEDSWRVERTGGEWGQAQQINNTGEQVHQLCQLSNYVSSKIFLYYIRILQWKLRLKGFFNLTKKLVYLLALKEVFNSVKQLVSTEFWHCSASTASWSMSNASRDLEVGGTTIRGTRVASSNRLGKRIDRKWYSSSHVSTLTGG